MDDDRYVDPDEFKWGARTDGGTPREAQSTDSGGAIQDGILPPVSRPRIFAVSLTLVLLLSMIFGFSGGAVADTNFTATNVNVTSHSGKLKTLEVAPTGHVHYQGFEQVASSATVAVSVKKSSDSSWEQIDSKTISPSGLSGNVSYDFATIDVLGSSSLTKQDFEAADGDTKSTNVDLRVSVTFADAGPGGTAVTSSSMDTFTVNVTNIAAGSGVGGRANTNGN